MPKIRQVAGIFVPILSLASILFVACENSTAVAWPAGAIPMVTPAPYALWWRVTESCSGLNGDFAKVRWYTVPGASEFVVNGITYQGVWYANTNRIVIADHSMLEGQLVRHEMLHALLQSITHPPEYFLDKCAGIVVCDRECTALDSAASAPPVGAVHVSVADVNVSTDVVPVEQSMQTDSAWVTIIVGVNNARPYPVWVDLTPMIVDPSISKTFGYDVFCSTVCAGRTNYAQVYGRIFGLTAGQTRRFSEDIKLLPGDFTVRTFFNSDTLPARAIQVSQ